MGFNILKTRGGKLENTIKQELTKDKPDLNVIMDSIYEYEKSNLATIEKLKRDKKIETNRINGAIKNFLNAHPVLTKELSGSLTKRIYGALLDDSKMIKKPKYEYKNIILGFFIGLSSMLFIYYFFL